MKVALIGKRAGSFIAGINSVSGSQIGAVCEADPKALDALGERAGVGESERYLSYEELLERAKPDAVALGTPTWRATWQVGKRGCTYGTHSLGPALEFFGPDARVVSVSCVGSGIHTDPEHLHDDTCLMLCQLDTGGLIKVRLDMMITPCRG